jgi:crotonobetainyl-CoA:carnitine CoA-transferase CaiB-like acyl-CoA transferase
VIKVEHPRGDPLRNLGSERDGVPLWWSVASRNKRCVTIDLSKAGGQHVLRRLVATADVFIENFRPGTLERWGIGPDVLHEVNPGLVIVRTTGFGQTGPYSNQPGYGTLAESMSGFAELNGWPDKPPSLPPFALADGVAGLTGTYAAMFALWWRDHGGRGKGQVVDLAIYEPLFWLLGPQASLYDRLGMVQKRTGNSAPFVSPRNAYQANDGRWLGLSASSQSIAERVMKIVGREDLVQEEWFRDHRGRLEHNDELDAIIGAWIAERDSAEVLETFAAGEAAIALMYTIEDIVEDPQYLERESVVRVEHPVLGDLLMQGVIPRLVDTPGSVQYPGAELGEHNAEIYGGLGLSPAQVDRLCGDGVL